MSLAAVEAWRIELAAERRTVLGRNDISVRMQKGNRRCFLLSTTCLSLATYQLTVSRASYRTASD